MEFLGRSRGTRGRARPGSPTLAINSRPINGGKMSETRFAEAMVCFDVFQVDLRARELRREGHRVKLQEQACRVLFLLIAEVPGGLPRLLPTISGADNLSPSWSRDGNYLYFASKRGTEPFQIWKMSVQGGSVYIQNEFSESNLMLVKNFR